MWAILITCPFYAQFFAEEMYRQTAHGYAAGRKVVSVRLDKFTTVLKGRLFWRKIQGL